MNVHDLAGHLAWGKLERDPLGELSGWHPLVDHMADVAACFMELAQCQGIRRALERAAQRTLSEVDLQRLAVLVFLHDIGKANAGFQGKRWRAAEKPSCWPHESGHGAEALLAFEIPALNLAQSLDLDRLCSWGDAVEGLLSASISHHGRPVRDNPLLDRRIWNEVKQSDGTAIYQPASVLVCIGQAATRMYPLAFADSADLLPEQPAFTHLFAGLVQLADWLGSDTRFFPYSEPGENRPSTAPAWQSRRLRAFS